MTKKEWEEMVKKNEEIEKEQQENKFDSDERNTQPPAEIVAENMQIAQGIFSENNPDESKVNQNPIDLMVPSQNFETNNEVPGYVNNIFDDINIPNTEEGNFVNGVEVSHEPVINKIELTSENKFSKLSDELKQEVVNLTCDLEIEYEYDYGLTYLNIDPKLKREKSEGDYQDYEQLKSDFNYINEKYLTYNYKQKYENIEFEPQIQRCKYQLSIWKYDQTGCVKVRDKYFNSELENRLDPDFVGFELSESIDGSKLLVQQKYNYKQESKI